VAESATVPWNAFCGTTVIVLAAFAPCLMLKLAGDALIAKRGSGDTVKLIAASLRKLPEAPVMKTVEIPGAAELSAVSVNVLGLVGVAALKDAVTPEGRPDAAKATVPPKP